VLEVGCGTGNYIAALVAHVGCRGWGIDPSVEMLDRAQDQVARRSLAVQLAPGLAEKLDLLDRQFDLIFSVDVIHHVQDRATYIQEASQALVPGGHLCTVTDSEWIIRRREPLSTYWPETVPVELARYPRIDHLAALYREVGLDALERDQAEHCATLTDIQAYRDRAFSSLHLISEPAFLQGLVRLERDLAKGSVPLVSRYTLLWGTRP
jgi:SAM-dependent methyltransferase